MPIVFRHWGSYFCTLPLLSNFSKTPTKAIAKYSENSKVFVLVHKMDLLNEENAQEPGTKEKKFAAKKAELEEIASKFSIKVQFSDFQGSNINF